MSEDKNSISVKELAAKLKVSDALLKKLVKDFGIETTKVKNRVHLEDSSVQTVREIMALRASGKKTQEIKELFDASQPTDDKKEEAKTQKKETKTQKKDSKTEKKASKEKAKKDTKDKKKKDSKAKKDKEEASEDKEEKPKSKAKKEKTNNKRSKKTRNKKDEAPQEEAEDGSMLNLNEYMDDDEGENDLKARLDVDEDPEEEIEEDFEEDLDDEDEEEEETSSKSSSKSKTKKQKFRRRQFSYKYIQRQIMNDQKRIKYIQQKLKRGRISTKEKMQLEESLEIRDKLLAGWVKLLRWVKS